MRSWTIICLMICLIIKIVLGQRMENINGTIQYGNYDYRVVNMSDCNNSPIHLTDNWKISPINARTLRVIRNGNMSESDICIVMRNGFSYNKYTTNKCDNIRYIRNNRIVRCEGRYLIRKKMRRNEEIRNLELIMDGAGATNWLFYNNGYMIASENYNGRVMNAMKIVNTRSSNNNGGYQRINNFNNVSRETKVFSVGSRCVNINRVGVDNYYGIYVDIYYRDRSVEYARNVNFDMNNCEEYDIREIEIYNNKEIEYINLYLLLRGYSGTVYFTDFRLKDGTNNLLQNSDFKENYIDSECNINTRNRRCLSTYKYWFSLSNSIETYNNRIIRRKDNDNELSDDIEEENMEDKENMILCNRNMDCGISNFIKNEHNRIGNSITFGGCSKYKNIKRSDIRNVYDYSIYLDILYEDNTWIYGINEPFDVNEENEDIWQCVSKKTSIRNEGNKKIKQIIYTPLYRGRKGEVLFSNLFLSSTTEDEIYNALSFGDPHIININGEKIEPVEEGEKILLKTNDNNIKIKSKYVRVGEESRALINGEIKIEIERDEIIINETGRWINKNGSEDKYKYSDEGEVININIGGNKYYNIKIIENEIGGIKLYDVNLDTNDNEFEGELGIRNNNIRNRNLREKRIMMEEEVKINNYCEEMVDERFKEECKIDMRNMRGMTIGKNMTTWRLWSKSELSEGIIGNYEISGGIRNVISKMMIIMLIIMVIIVNVKI